MISEAVVALGVIGIVILSLVGAFSICCLCCAVPVWLLFSRLFTRRGKSSSEYQMVEVSDRRSEFVAPSAPLYDASNEPIAEAYLVPPLAAVHTENSDIVMGVPMDATTPLQEKSEKSGNGFKDVWAALLFLGNVVFVVWFAVQAYYNASESVDDVSISASDSVNNNLTVLNTLVVACLGLAVVASIVGSLWLGVLMQHSEFLIELVMWTNIILLVVGAVGCLLVGQLIGTIIFGLLAALSYWFYLSVKHRIPFASAVIRTACMAIKANYTGLLSVSYGMMVCQVVWFMAWSAASYGVYVMMEKYKQSNSTSSTTGEGSHHQSEDSDSDDNTAQKWVTFGLLISLFWGAQVIKGIVQTTVCGTVACWWFQPNRSAAVRGSLFRSVTTSFGSICFGGLIVALIQAMRELLHMVRQQATKRRGRDRNVLLECFIGIAEYLLSCIEAALQYFNTYAYCYVAAYGLDFMTSGKQVTALFQRRGWSAIINDTLISRTITMSVMAVAVIVGLFGAVASQGLIGTTYATNVDYKQLAGTGGALGLLMGFAVGMILCNALESAVAMVFVSFAEDPSALQINHNTEFDNLVSKWQMTYPESMQWMTCVNNSSYGGHMHHGGSGLYSQPMAQAVPVAQYGGAHSQVNYLGSASAPAAPSVTLPHGSYSYNNSGKNPPPTNPSYVGK